MRCAPKSTRCNHLAPAVLAVTFLARPTWLEGLSAAAQNVERSGAAHFCSKETRTPSVLNNLEVYRDDMLIFGE